MVLQAKGALTKCLFAKETTYGEDPADLATKAICMYFNTNGLSGSQNKTDPNTIRNSRQPVPPIMGNIDEAGDLVTPLDYLAYPYLLALEYGNPTTEAGSVEGTYVHTFIPSDTQPSFVIEKGFPDINTFIKANGVKISKAAYSFGGDGELVITNSCLGQKEVIGTSAMCASPTIPGFLRTNNFHGGFKIDDVDVMMATQFSMNIDHGLDGDSFVIGGKGYRQTVNEGLIKVDGTLTALFGNSTLLEKAASGTPVGFETYFTYGYNKIQFILPECMMT